MLCQSQLRAERHRGNAMSSISVFASLVVFLVADMALTSNALADTNKRNEIKLVDNGYEGILIAIGEAAPVSQRTLILTRIKVGSS